MKGRKLLACGLIAALCLGLAAPALAAEMTPEQATMADANTAQATIEASQADQALLAVTAKVKLALSLDTEGYLDFQGWSDEDVLLGTRWHLEWVGDGSNLSVVADDNGKIYSYNRYEAAAEENAVWYSTGKLTIPRLPTDKSQDALATARSFLGRVLEGDLESVTLDDSGVPSLQQTSYRYTGTIFLNGLTSPITCSVTVRASDLAVTRFSRSDLYSGYVGELPGAFTYYTEAQARALLGSTITMKAEYVLNPGTKVAVLRYLPVSGDQYYVDGATGKLVNLTELYKQLWSAERGGASSANKYAVTEEAMADLAAPTAGLTQAERDGAAILAGAMSKEDLDKVLKNTWPEMGLGDYTLSSASYGVVKKEGVQEKDYDVTCRLTYSREQGQLIRNKTVTVDAKTGAVQNLYSNRFYRGEGEDTFNTNFTVGLGQNKADAALKVLAGTRTDKVALADSVNALEAKSWENLYTYQQASRGYFYPGNYYTIGVDATDGTISRINFYFDDDVILQLPDKVIDSSAAARAYLAAMEVPYGYLEVPVAVSQIPGDIMPLLKEAGYSYITTLKTGYTLSQPQGAYVSGVDAETGEAVIDTFGADTRAPLAYDDLAGHWVKNAAEALAVFGVGLRVDSLEPDRALNQRDMVALLASVDGYTYDPATATAEEIDWLYRYGYTLGLVTPETRDEAKVITRGEMVKLILDGAGYERVASLPGIFRCDFSDADSLEGATLGYAALAQGLGLVNGGSSAAYAPAREITRAEAIAMLYQYMK